MGTVHQLAFTQAVVMALRCVLLPAIVVVLASVDFVSADGDILHGKDCYSDSQCMSTISYCDNSKGGVLSKVVSGKFSETLGGAMGECRIVSWFWPLISILILSVVGTICCSCLCCVFCPLYHLGKCLRPDESV